ncbi:hypothetical protein LB518_10130 [Mesorhizobium sp. BR1-1-16]|uniref:hypothetical protein n=1 Tax=Mesorhizobium sp. BR1-1-16 TaxID=2876653 RepID=UPI001CC904CE|nr:hypothetical protein [Mesorhizobium sp. BR1-1-16]MBZ9936653.1 hypothetical protein [Mesorhizobium sp. BR1-1-16]
MSKRTIDDRSFLWFSCWTLDYVKQVERLPTAEAVASLPAARAKAEAQHRSWHFECLAELRRMMAESYLSSSGVPDAVTELPSMRQFLDDLGGLLANIRALFLDETDDLSPRLSPTDYEPGKVTVREVVSATWLSHGAPDRSDVARLLSRGIPTGCAGISYDKVRHLLIQNALQMSGLNFSASSPMSHVRAFLIPSLHEQRVTEQLWAIINERRSIRSVKSVTTELVRTGEFLTLYQKTFSEDLNARTDSEAAVDAVLAAAIAALQSLYVRRRAEEPTAAKPSS